MHVHLSQLIDELRDSVSLSVYNISDADAVSGIRVLPGREHEPEGLDPDCLYVCEYRRLKRIPTERDLPPLLCIIEPGITPVTAYLNTRRVIAVYGSTMTSVLSAVSEKMFELGARTNYPVETMNLLRQCRSMDDLLQTGFHILHNPIVITDDSHQIVAATSPALVSDDLYAEMCNRGYLPVGLPTEKSEHPDWSYLQFLNPEGQPDPALTPMLCRLLSLHGKTIGCIHVALYNAPFTAENYTDAELIANMAEMKLWINRTHPASRDSRKLEQEHFLRDILDGSDSTEEELRLRMERLKLSLKPYLYAVAFSRPHKNGNANLPLHELSKKISDFLPNTTAFAYGDSIMGFVNSPFEIHDFREFLRPVEEDLRKNGLAAGISNRFSRLDRFTVAGYQAGEAIRLGHTVDPEGSVYLYKKYQIYHLLRICLKSDEIENICMPEVLHLVEYCESSGSSDLIDTLYMLIRCGMNKSKTAANLFVHVNTVKYRLSQIELITGLNMNEPDEFLGLMLSLKLLDFQKKLFRIENPD